LGFRARNCHGEVGRSKATRLHYFVGARTLGCGSFNGTIETFESFNGTFETSFKSFNGTFETFESFNGTVETFESFNSTIETFESFNERAGAADFSRACQSDFQSPTRREQDSTVAQAHYIK